MTRKGFCRLGAGEWVLISCARAPGWRQQLSPALMHAAPMLAAPRHFCNGPACPGAKGEVGQHNVQVVDAAARGGWAFGACNSATRQVMGSCESAALHRLLSAGPEACRQHCGWPARHSTMPGSRPAAQVIHCTFSTGSICLRSHSSAQLPTTYASSALMRSSASRIGDPSCGRKHTSRQYFISAAGSCHSAHQPVIMPPTAAICTQNRRSSTHRQGVEGNGQARRAGSLPSLEAPRLNQADGLAVTAGSGS